MEQQQQQQRDDLSNEESLQVFVERVSNFTTESSRSKSHMKQALLCIVDMAKSSKYQVSVDQTYLRVLDGIPFAAINKEEQKNDDKSTKNIVAVLYFLLSGGRRLEGNWLQRRLNSGLSDAAVILLDRLTVDSSDLSQYEDLFCQEGLFERKALEEGAPVRREGKKEFFVKKDVM